MQHLYLHVPFCSRRCSYCDFAIAVRREVPSERFVAAVRTEYARRRESEGWEDGPWETVYLGGGTPSHLAPEAIARLLEFFQRAPGAEVTLEANPEDVTADCVRAWRAAGVTRVSLGVQSFDDAVLAWMHRTHDAAAARRALDILCGAGLTSVSADLIFALPEHLERDLERDVAELLAFPVDHVSIYGLSLELRTPYARWRDRGETQPPPDDRYAAEFLRLEELLGGAGFEHYEISNYARPGARSRHNSAYWTGADYLGLGPSAHGLRGTVRRWNVRDWSAYDRAVAAGEEPLGGEECLDDAQVALERVYLGLRTAEGLPPPEADKLMPEAVLAAERGGWLTVDERGVRATASGWLVLDALVPALTTFREGG